MAIGPSVLGTCSARAALAGNPSDGFGGAVLAVPVPALTASVTAVEGDRWAAAVDDPALARLLRASLAGWTERHQLDSFPPLTLTATTSIPRSVGLGGSSALVIATLRAIAAWRGTSWDPIELAQCALDVETVRLGISAGLQDRLVQAVDEPVAMTFAPVGYEVVRPPVEPPFFVAWAPDAAEPSDAPHRALRRRFDDGEPAVVDTIRALADRGRRAHAAIVAGDVDGLGVAMDSSFDLRCSIVDVGDRQREMIAAGRDAGAWVNSAGSGGSVVGLVRDRATLASVAEAYGAIGAEFLELR